MKSITEIGGASTEISRLVWKSPSELFPSPENEQLYRDTDQSLREFAERIKRDGILEPIVVTEDCYIVSGHRRHAAATIAGLGSLPCRVIGFKRSNCKPEDYVRLLREFNRQRSKSIDEIIREAAVDADPTAAYTALVNGRTRAAMQSGGFTIEEGKQRSAITDGKLPMLEAALAAIEARKAFHPLSARQVHYCLLSAPPLRHAKKPGSTYANDRASYQDLVDLLVRARVSGRLSWECIADETRPVSVWPVNRNSGEYVRKELSDLFSNYWRDLQQSQPDHLEVVIEKNASLGVVKLVAMKYCIPITSGRGQCSKDRLWQISERFRKSKKRNLVLLLLSDFDPDGDAISQASARSLRDDLDVPENRLLPVRVALRPDQIQHYALPRSMEAKATSSNYGRFVHKHGVSYAVELEALNPEDLQTELDKSIRAHIDVGLFDKEVEAENLDAAKHQQLKSRIMGFMRGGGWQDQ